MKIALKAVFLVLTLASVTAQAAVVLIDQQPDEGQFLSRARYQLNTELGRAWLELDFAKPNYSDPRMPSMAFQPYTIRTLVVGLSYDASSSQVLYTGEKGTVVCANVTLRHGVFGSKLMIAPTGFCKAHSVHGVKNVDDGFNIHEKKVVDTYFGVSE